MVYLNASYSCSAGDFIYFLLHALVVWERRRTPSANSASSSRVVTHHTSDIGRSMFAFFITLSTTTSGEIAHPRLKLLLYSRVNARCLFTLSCIIQHWLYSMTMLRCISTRLSPFPKSHRLVVSSMGIRSRYCYCQYVLGGYAAGIERRIPL